MKIIFSPSKEMDFIKKNIFENNLEIPEIKETSKIYETIIQLSDEEVSKRFKIKESIFSEFKNDLKNYKTSSEKTALEAYSGISFRQLELNDYTLDDFEYIKEHLYILSAFYGVNNATDRIRKHRLDFSVKLFEEMSLHQYWKQYINSFFEANELIVNLASTEYSKIIDRKQHKMLDIYFYENKDYKQISTNSKKARGEMLNLMIKNKIKEPNEIKKLKLKQYKFKEELSNDEKIVFMK